MRTRTFTFGILTLLSTSMLILAQTETAAARFDRATNTANTKGLEAAIPIYDSILRDFPNDRVNSAKALVQLGRSFDFLGQTEKARQKLQQVIDQYADQTDRVAESRRLLSALPPPPKPRDRAGIFIAEMDPRTGTIREPVRTITRDPSGWEVFATFSPDGKSLAFRRFQGPTCCANGIQVVLSLETNEERTTRGSPTPCVGLSAGPSRWFRDGKGLWAVTRSTPNAGNSCVFRYDLDKGLAFETLLRAGSDLIANYATLSPDEKTLYGDQAGPSNIGTRSAPVTVVQALDMVTGQPTRTYALPLLQGRSSEFSDMAATPPIIATRPDGRSIAHVRWANSLDAHLVLYDIDGQDLRYRELLFGVGRMQILAWSKDGGRVFFATSPAPDIPWRIMQISAEGGPARFTGLEVTGLFHFDLSPDGSQIVFDGLAYRISPPDSYTLAPLTAAPRPTAPARP
jgi:hypothetical protein